jgi:hypothetical protein
LDGFLDIAVGADALDGHFLAQQLYGRFVVAAGTAQADTDHSFHDLAILSGSLSQEVEHLTASVDTIGNGRIISIFEGKDKRLATSVGL